MRFLKSKRRWKCYVVSIVTLNWRNWEIKLLIRSKIKSHASAKFKIFQLTTYSVLEVHLRNRYISTEIRSVICPIRIVYPTYLARNFFWKSIKCLYIINWLVRNFCNFTWVFYLNNKINVWFVIYLIRWLIIWRNIINWWRIVSQLISKVHSIVVNLISIQCENIKFCYPSLI